MKPLRVISLGAGVQSTTLALMAAKSAIGPMPDCAVFADTGWVRDLKADIYRGRCIGGPDNGEWRRWPAGSLLRDLKKLG